MKPIRIKAPDSDFTFTIDEGRLKGIGKVYFEGRHEFSFSLKEISPEPVILERRHPYFRQGLVVVVLGFISAAFFRLLESSDVRTFLLLLMGVLVVTGLSMTLLFFRPYRFLTVINQNGSGLFRLTRTPANAASVDRLISAIRSEAPPAQNTDAEQAVGGNRPS